MSKAKTPEQKAADKAKRDAAKSANLGAGTKGPVTVAYEGGLTRTYEGDDAGAKAAEFVGKSPNTRRVI